MNQTLKYVGLALVFLLVGAVIAGTMQQYYMQQTATVTGVTVILGGTLYLNGTLVNWGLLERGKTYETPLDVNNTLDTPITVALALSTLPSGWTEQWNLTETTIQPNTYAHGLLNLTIPLDAPLETFSWDMWLNIAT